MANTDKPHLPNYVSPARRKIDADLKLIDNLLDGPRAMWEASNQPGYIRKWKDEAPEVYDLRRLGEPCFGGLDRTLTAAVGMMFRTAPVMTWNASETAMAAQWANLDGAGTHGDVFLKRFAEIALPQGLALILVDHPPRPVDENKQPIVITMANEAEYNFRPLWTRYEREHIVSWQVGTVQNRQTITQIVFSEEAETPSGFGVKCTTQYRVLRLVQGIATWSLYEPVKDNPEDIDGFRLVGSGIFRNRNGEVMRGRLPIAVAYTGRTEKPLDADMPLLPVAFANLGHWQAATDLTFGRRVAAIEQPVVTGELKGGIDSAGNVTPGQVRLGWLVAVHLESQGTFTWQGPSGKGLEQLAKGRDEKLVEMGQLGLSFLIPDARAAETATAKRLDKVAEHATIATAAQGIADAANEALELHAWYLGIEKAGAPTVALSTDFEASGPDAPLLTAFAALSKAGFPKQPLVEAMQRMELVAAGADVAKIAQDWEDGEAASNAAAADMAAINTAAGVPPVGVAA
jgi:hypothetical protein